MKKTCPWCNEDFRPSRDWQQWCCTQCQQAWHRHQRKVSEMQAAKARANRAKELVERHIARVEAAVQAQVPAQAEPLRRRL
jgi:hypothetical protein